MPDYKLTVTRTLDFKRPEIEQRYTDQTLHVDISKADISIQPVAQETKETFVGGKGYDLWLLWNAVQADTRWNDPQNAICIACGPLGGTPIYPGSGKSIVTTISPLTAAPIDSNVGGHFGPLLKLAGFDIEAIGFDNIDWENLEISIDVEVSYEDMDKDEQEMAKKEYYNEDGSDNKEWSEKDAMKEDEMTGNALLSRLERRLDNMVYRAGFARSIRQARQMVVHGMIEVGGRKIDRPSYAVSVDEEIVLKEKYRSNVHFDENMKSAITPKYMLVDGPRAVLSRIPDTDEIPVEVDMHLVVEYYSR